MTITFRQAPHTGPVADLLDRSWGGVAALHDRHWRLADLDALVAERDGTVVGVLTVDIRADVLEIVSCDADPPGRGVGSALIRAALEHAREQGCTSVRVTTTNDNLGALGFYQALGFRIVAVWPDAVAQARRVKPSIPTDGHRGLPIRDEIDLAYEV